MRDSPRPERGVFCILIIDIILISALILCTLLCTGNYHYNKGPICYVLTLYSHYCYGALSILFVFILSQDTPTQVHLLLRYIDIQQLCYYIYNVFLNYHVVLFSHKCWICSFVVFLNTMFHCRKKSTTFQFSIIQIVVKPLKYGAPSSVGWLWWGRYWLRYKSSSFR